VLAGQLREEHHAKEKEVDVGAFDDGVTGETERNETEGKEEQHACGDPVDLGNATGAKEHHDDAEGDDGGQEKVG